VRGIVTRLSAEYPRKARGLLTAVSRVTVPAVTGPTEVTVMAEITDESGDLVCRVTAVWRLDRKGSSE
jgi:hypothetical protein